jgi:hypothetical protein
LDGFVQNESSDDYAFCEKLKDHSFFQLNEAPTHYGTAEGNTLDLILSNEPSNISNIQSISPDAAGIFTDHHLLEFDISTSNYRIKKPARFVYNFKAADLKKIKNNIQNSNALKEAAQISSIEDGWQKLGGRTTFWES